MVDGIRGWLISVACAAMLAAAAESLCPEGTVKKVGKLAGGLLLLLALLRPLADWKGIDTRVLQEPYEAQTEAYSDALERENEKLLREIIAEKTGAYIVDKAEELGFSCEVTVEVREEDGVPIPWQAEVSGQYTQSQRQALESCISADLDIPAQRQIYRLEEVK